MPPLKVLIADDHAIVRAGFRRVIESIPGLVVAAETGDGIDVKKILGQESFHLLMIDVTMPNFQPITAIREIRNEYPELKILVVSAYDDDIYVKGLLQAGVNGYHLKDESLDQLKLAIERVLKGERWISESLIGKLIRDPVDQKVLPEITTRQRELLKCLREGLDNKSISGLMGISVKTVENHLTRLYRNLEVNSRLEAVNFINRFPQILGVEGLQAAEKYQGDVKLPASISILVLDDNARYRKQMLHMIGKANSRAKIFEAASISEAIHLVEKVDINLAFIDVILKGEDGITGSRRLHLIKPEMRIILISAYPDREFHRQGLESGASAFLDKKNLDLPTLKSVIQDVAN